jgi:peptidoglycan/xylan/chitin deacetylase (PgdA/CDA1 family)
MVLTYHEIEAQRSGDLYRVSYEQLEAHLALLAQLFSSGEPPSLPPVTFDDGHLSNFHYGVPLLQKYALQATFFVPAGWIGTKPAAMTWQHLREIGSLGYQIQSHSWSHPLLTRCSDSRLQGELERSKKTLEDKLGSQVEAISIPHGRWNHRVLDACDWAGYKRVYTSDPWLSAEQRQGVRLAGRLTVRSTMDPVQLRRFLRAQGISLMLLRAPYVIKEGFRRLVGDRLYHRLWCSFARREEPRGEGLQ